MIDQGNGYDLQLNQRLQLLASEMEDTRTADVPGVAAVFNVKTMGGATGDGVADESTPFTTALSAQGIKYAPAGTYLLNSTVLFGASNVTLRGEGWQTVIKNGHGAAMFQTSAAYGFVENITIEDMTLDGDGGLGVSLYGAHAGNITFRRVRFQNLTTYAVGMTAVDNVTFEDCVFHDDGTPIMTAILAAEACAKLTIRRCRFEYLKNGIIIDTGSGTTQTEDVMSGLVVEGCHFDAGWYYIKDTYNNSGGTVTYTSTTVTDTAASFGALTALNNVVAMPTLESGSVGAVSFGRTRLNDASATFVTNLVKQGHIVRTATKFGVVRNVKSETDLYVEEWLDRTTYEVTSPPVATTAYTVHGIWIGKIVSNTSTEITVDRWHDIEGTAVTPSSGTYFEVKVTRPNYPLHAEYSQRDARIVDNVFLRGWSDQISIFGYRATIAFNRMERGQDMGITLHGQDNVVVGNRAVWQGVGGIWTVADNSVIVANHCLESGWVNPDPNGANGGITVLDGSFNLLTGNQVRVDASPGKVGIVLRATGAASNVGNVLTGNYTSGHSVSGLRLYADAGDSVDDIRATGNIWEEATKVSNAGGGTFTFDNQTEWYDTGGVRRAHIDPAGHFASGPVPSQVGGVRLSNLYAVTSRNDTNTGDLSLIYGGAANEIYVGGGIIKVSSSSTNRLYVTSGDVRLIGVPLRMAVLTADPAVKVRGTVAYADGTTWNPGSGEGLYRYNGTAWVFIG